MIKLIVSLVVATLSFFASFSSFSQTSVVASDGKTYQVQKTITTAPITLLEGESFITLRPVCTYSKSSFWMRTKTCTEGRKVSVKDGAIKEELIAASNEEVKNYVKFSLATLVAFMLLAVMAFIFFGITPIPSILSILTGYLAFIMSSAIYFHDSNLLFCVTLGISGILSFVASYYSFPTLLSTTVTKKMFYSTSFLSMATMIGLLFSV